MMAALMAGYAAYMMMGKHAVPHFEFSHFAADLGNRTGRFVTHSKGTQGTM